MSDSSRPTPSANRGVPLLLSLRLCVQLVLIAFLCLAYSAQAESCASLALRPPCGIISLDSYKSLVDQIAAKSWIVFSISIEGSIITFSVVGLAEGLAAVSVLSWAGHDARYKPVPRNHAN